MELGKQKGKKTDDLIELESGEDEDEDEDEDKDALKSAAVAKTNQGGSGNLSSGRATRNSLRRPWPPSSATRGMYSKLENHEDDMAMVSLEHFSETSALVVIY